MTVLAVAVLLTGSMFGADSNVPKFLQKISVTILSGHASGSGVLFTRQDANSNSVTLVWTAGHVVADLRGQRTVVTPDGNTRTIVEFQDAKIVQQLVEDGRLVGRLEIDAEVIRYSDADDGEDLALLKVRKKNFVEDTARFYTGAPPDLGTELFHVGSLLGQMGANSLTTGIYSQHGRLLGKTVFDQTTVAAFPGSSGGGVFLKDGAYVGMLVRGSGETFNLIVPIRRMSAWAKKAKVEWALNPSISMPSDDALAKLPIEDVGKTFQSSYEKDASKPTPNASKIHTWLGPVQGSDTQGSTTQPKTLELAPE